MIYSIYSPFDSDTWADLIICRIIIIKYFNLHLSYSNPDIHLHELTCIFHKPLFMPYLAQVGGDHRRKGIWSRWMGVFHCPVRPSSFPHLLPSLHILPCPPPPPPLPILRPPLPCQSHEAAYSCLADITCLNWAQSTHIPGRSSSSSSWAADAHHSSLCLWLKDSVVLRCWVTCCCCVYLLINCCRCIQSVGLWWCKKAQLCCLSPLMSCLGGSALQLSSVQAPCVLLCVQDHTTV